MRARLRAAYFEEELAFCVICHLAAIVLGVLGLRYVIFSGVLPEVNIFSLGDGMILGGLLLFAAVIFAALLSALEWLIARLLNRKLSTPTLIAVPLMDSLMLFTLLTAVYLMLL